MEKKQYIIAIEIGSSKIVGVIAQKELPEGAVSIRAIQETKISESVRYGCIKNVEEVKRSSKEICANVDFYSGFVYQMLGLPTELFTPLFAVARMAGWSAHRLEELINQGKIIRPAYKNVVKRGLEYVDISNR